jgi:transcriptional regulator with PAS, ATPase and Fis domain
MVDVQQVVADRAVARADVRVVAATNRDLRDMITQGSFREDLFYRLNVIHIAVPSLRERREDIPALVDYFVGQFTASWSRVVTTSSAPLMSRSSSECRT